MPGSPKIGPDGEFIIPQKIGKTGEFVIDTNKLSKPELKEVLEQGETTTDPEAEEN